MVIMIIDCVTDPRDMVCADGSGDGDGDDDVDGYGVTHTPRPLDGWCRLMTIDGDGVTKPPIAGGMIV